MRDFAEHVLGEEGSMRAAALLRMALVAQVWVRFDSNVHWIAMDRPELFLGSTVFWIASPLAFAGAFTRVSLPLTALATAWVYYYQAVYLGQPAIINHHSRLLATAIVLLCLSPAGRALSVDRLLAVRSAQADGREAPDERGSLLGTRLIALQVSTIYFWSAFEKADPAFVSGVRMQQILHTYFFGSDWIGDLWLPVFFALGVGSMASQAFLCVALWIRRWHRFVIPYAVVMHFVMYYLLEVATFTSTMYVLYIAFLDPLATHRFLDRHA